MTATLDDDLIGDEPDEEYPTPIGPPTRTRDGVVRLTPYIGKAPRPKQSAFLMLRGKEAFYGGAAGGGKTFGLLMALLQFVDVPGYSALALQKTYKDMRGEGTMLKIAEQWLRPTDARWSAGDKAWYFPSGASLFFGHCAKDTDVMNYRGWQLQAIAIDETTRWTEWVYRYMFSRLRRPVDETMRGSDIDGLTLAGVPLRMRSGSNPGDVGHAWVKRRLVDKATRVCPFIPARTEDLEGVMDVKGYLRNLREMDPVNWARYAKGDWEIRDPGEIFDSTNLKMLDAPWPVDPRNIKRIRFWDMAGTAVNVTSSDKVKARARNDPDWTVGFRLARNKSDGTFCIEHIARVRREPSEVERIMRQTAELDGPDVPIWIEQEPGSEGKYFINNMRRHVLAGFSVHGDPAAGSGPKPSRIAMLEPIVNNGDCSCVLGPWTQAFLDEIDAWPNVDHDDQLDAFAGAHRNLTSAKARIIV